MEHLNNEDYKKIKNIIETFIDTPIIVDNLFKSLVIFLEVKKKQSIKVITTEEPVTPISPTNILKVQTELKNADEAMDRFTDRIRNSNVKRKRKASN
tara:strand:- start:1995 stop:2285 length:291 start_codon:yes stop_codon:yes gene_type:complete